jgi:cardiolipin synthase
VVARVNEQQQHGTSMRLLAEQTFSRTAGAPLVPGNSLRLLQDARENFSAWLAALADARQRILFENYIFTDDTVGRTFADVLIERARAGVQVHVLYDWLGSRTTASRRYWRALREAGVEVRAHNPPRLDSPLGWLSRDHRKSLVVDDRVAFVSGLCVSGLWLGNPARGLAPWRDTGVALRGPAVADVAAAFAAVWAGAGAPLPTGALPERGHIPVAGEVAVRVVDTTPNDSGLYRLQHLMAALARKRLWVADAYAVGTSTFIQSVRAASQDGVDVRILVPGTSDLPLLQSFSRAGYRPLLEAGVRVFEWNGSMMHAKTGVVDGRFLRVGSSNLNVASWLNNHELDIVVEDEGLGREMEERFLRDLEGATEIVLNARSRVRRLQSRRSVAASRASPRGSMGAAAAGAVRLGSTVGAAMADMRELGPAESRVLRTAGLGLLGVAGLAALWPRVLAWPLAGVGAWFGASLLARARHIEHRPAPTPPSLETPPREAGLGVELRSEA